MCLNIISFTNGFHNLTWKEIIRNFSLNKILTSYLMNYDVEYLAKYLFRNKNKQM